MKTAATLVVNQIRGDEVEPVRFSMMRDANVEDENRIRRAIQTFHRLGPRTGCFALLNIRNPEGSDYKLRCCIGKIIRVRTLVI